MATVVYLPESMRVLLISKSDFNALDQSASHWAQGGIAAVWSSLDSPDQHVADTMAAGAGRCELAAVQALVDEGPARVRDLISLGVPFEQKNGEFDLTQEGGHSARRVLHVGDRTGLAIMTTLTAAAKARPNLTVWSEATMVSLATVGGVCHGAWVQTREGRIRLVTARAVVLATGGCGQVYSRTTNPMGATGDGLALAMTVGAVVRDMAFVQFHPTALAVNHEGPSLLISEAVRGEGGILRDADGVALMAGRHERGDLAPRDVVARTVWEAMRRSGADHVDLDVGSVVGFGHRFPAIAERCDALGVDWRLGTIPVSPAAHYMMGGVRTDLEGRTSVAGLFAVGEVASTGVHGANRLASNSLLEGLVFGARVANAIGGQTMGSPSKRALQAQNPVTQHPVDLAQNRAVQTAIRTTMWKHAGIIRSSEGLVAAERMLKEMNPDHFSDSFETWAMWRVATEMVRDAQNQASVGAHFKI